MPPAPTSFLRGLATLIALCQSLSFAAPAPADVDPRRLLLALKPGHQLAALDLPQSCQVRSPEDRLPPSPVAPRGAILPADSAPEFHVLEMAEARECEALRQRLAAHPAIHYVEYDGIGQGGAVTPNDPSYSSQWHHNLIGSPEAWGLTQGSSSVVLAVLDTGMNVSLPDFASRVLPGYDFANDDSNPDDDQGHGSAVAAVAVGTGHNGIDTAGVDWNCRIMPIKVLDSDNNGFYSWWADGIRWATDQGADVINLSAGGSSSSTTLTAAIDYAISRGVIFVTITHNDSSSTIRFPGRLPQAITVGATQNNDVVSDFSNYGNTIDLVAPGGAGSGGGNSNIGTTSRTGSTQFWWGTSFAAPQVAGAAALLRAINPRLRQADVETILCAAADDRVGDIRDRPGFDNYHGYGRLNIPSALMLARTIPMVTYTGGVMPNVNLRWPMPSNAASKRPLAVEFTENFLDWFPVPSQAISYSRIAASLNDDGSATGSPPGRQRYYRWAIQR